MNSTYLRIFFVLGIPLVLVTTTTLAVNCSHSFNYKYFLLANSKSFKRDDLVQITGHDTTYFKGIKFIKQVKGVAGDLLTVTNNNIAINSQIVGRLVPKTQTGQILTPIKTKLIPEGYVFVLAPHSRSFDSRYQEFGLVKTSCITGRVLFKCWRLGQ